MKRECGILLPIFSLPSPYGIGTLGEAARQFADFLHDASVTWWQILPLGPTGSGNSPYQSPSSYAGNPYLIDLDLLCQAGLLLPSELPEKVTADSVDYEGVFSQRDGLFRKAFDRRAPLKEKISEFAAEKASWLRDYALYRALKRRFNQKPWYEWEKEIRERKADAVARYEKELSEEIAFEIFLQYLFYTQWQSLRDYAAERGVRFLGDLPIYVALDSADVWASPESFLLDGAGKPTAVAGVPPDCFSRDGQLWGNPLYDWDAMKKDGYGWWIRRVDGAAHLYDALRIDHFRGFADYWSVPVEAKTAKEGAWKQGPGMSLVGVLTGWFPQLQFVAEDLGTLTPEVFGLLEAGGLPGMKVLEFAFDDTEASVYLPHKIGENCVCYTGTHDNPPLGEWVGSGEADFACEYLGCKKENLAEAMLRAGMQSKARLFVSQMQDWLGLGRESRTNIPGTATGNWKWKLSELPSAEVAKKIARMAKIYDRAEKKGK